MKLYYSDTSPFARKNRIVARDLGILNLIEEIPVSPMANPPELVAANPIVQVPTLVLDGGEIVIGSPLINAHLCHAAGSEKIYAGDVLGAKRLEFMADGAAEMLVKIAFENVRPPEIRYELFLQRWRDNARRAFQYLDSQLVDAHYNIGSVAAVVALSYGLFRMPDVLNGLELPNIYKLHDEYGKMPHFIETKPK